ncbi:MAG TPA: two-component regulator propeller domain-containing protein [Candidatus Didemnitutus sp.]|nr:two-component regulator propeller domain-containing protein [Candidatus Didemnitutus sp.]
MVGLLLWPAAMLALDPSRSLTQYNARTWRRVNQLPSNSVTAVVQAADGHMWLGTPRGLVDFDGMEFKSVGLPGQDDTRSRIITCLARRSAGGLWVGTERGGYGSFDGIHFAMLAGAHLGGDAATIRVLGEMRDGSLYVSALGTIGQRLPAGTEEVFSTEMDVLSLCEDDHGRVWMGTANAGLLYRENGELRKVEGPAAQLWAGQAISAITVDRQGIIWVGAANGVHSMNPDFSPRPSIGYTSQPGSLLIDSHGVLWIGGLFNGLTRYENGVLSTMAHADGLASDRVQALAESADGSLWIGTEDGLTQLSEVKFPILSRGEGLSGDASLCVAADPAGGVWVGTNNGLTHVVDGVCTKFGNSRHDGFPSEWIRRVFVARDGTVYTMGGHQDINRFRNGRVEKTWYPGSWSQSIVEDAQGIIFTNRNKLVRLVDDEMTPYRLASGKELEFGWINKLMVARDGTLWIAGNPGLAQVRNGELLDWGRNRSNEDLVFFYLCEDDAGGIWAARNTGLVRIKDGRVSTVDHHQGLHSDHVFAIVPDLQGNFWMDSPEGVFRVSQRELNDTADGKITQLACTVYDGSHVIKSAEKLNSEYSACRSNDGRIWLSSAKGVIQLDPTHLPVNSRPPPTQLLRVRVDGSEYPIDREPNLKSGARNLEFEYSAIDYQAPERIRYRYRLEGFESDWVDAGSRRSAYYTNLPPGDYRFHVQACNADGVWNTEGAGYHLTLRPELHEYWWFRVGLGAAGVGLVGLAWAYRDRNRKREIAEILHREKLQIYMIESSPVPMLMLDSRQRVLYANATFTQVFGYTSSELPDIGTWWQLACSDPAAQERLAANWNRRLYVAAATGGSVEAVETTLLHKDRSVRHTLITTSAVGERTLVICSDLTERKRAEDERARLEEQLRQGQKMEAIGRLSGGIAHDFNNLLTVILGNVTLLELDGHLTSEVADSTRHIKNAAKRAAHLTSQLLAFSRTQPLQAVGIDLNHAVKEMTTMLQRIVGEDVRMEMQPASGALPTKADASKIEQMVLNLVLNARDAMPKGGRLVVATSMAEFTACSVPAVLNARPGRFVCQAVSDTGCGIRQEIMPRIFDPFFTTKEVGKGTGLGLATVFGIVEQHHGWIDVQSSVDRGSTFRIYLPASTEPIAAPAASTDDATRPPMKVAGRRILLVEDDHGVRNYARKILIGAGHQVLEAASGQLALPVWKDHRHEIEILLTDVVMPDGLNGLELAKRLQQEKPALKVIYASGYSADVAGGDFAGRQGIDFVAKPYSPAELLRIVERIATSERPMSVLN